MKRCLLLLLIVLLFSSCYTMKVKKTDETIPTKEFKELYGNSYLNLQVLKAKYYESYYFPQYKKLILESNELSEDEQDGLINRMKRFKWEDGECVAVMLSSYQYPLRKSDLEIKFEIIDANGNSLADDMIFYNYKQITVSEYGSYESYIYTWLIKTTIPLHKDNEASLGLPVKAKIHMPDGRVSVFDIK